MALPPDDFIKAVSNLEALYKKGIRYPISYFGADVDPRDGFPPPYRKVMGADKA
jgi:hypothetical protein